ncbi:MAG: T9SS type A sorting domain-containing protein [Flavobacteriales bacterium]|nr:T9SS type A sorting domain-containing protein [Flavobacteriales bacterium]
MRVTSENGSILGYELFDATGRRVRQHGVSAAHFTMDRAGLHAGAYFLTIRFASGNVTRKVVLD